MGKTNKLKYPKPEELQAACDAYFEDCKGAPLVDEDGVTATDKYGIPIIIGSHPPTVTGLALWLGFKTRQSLLNYQHRSKQYNDILTEAKSRCEEYAERRLYDRDGCNGAKFSLTNNFKGWREKPEEEKPASEEVQIIDDV